MPRGNDAEAASADLQAAAADLIAQGGVTTNAEALIDANVARQDPALARVSLMTLDEEATAELDLEEVAGEADLPEGHSIVAAAVRGTAVSYVARGVDGRDYKGVYFPEGDEPDVPPEQALAHESAKANLKATAAIAEARAKADAKVAEARAEIDAEATKEIEKARKEAAKQVEKAAKDVEKAESEAAEADTEAKT